MSQPHSVISMVRHPALQVLDKDHKPSDIAARPGHKGSSLRLASSPTAMPRTAGRLESDAGIRIKAHVFVQGQIMMVVTGVPNRRQEVGPYIAQGSPGLMSRGCQPRN